MSRPPGQKVAATRRTVSSLSMARTTTKKVCSNYPARVAILAALALAGLSFLTACQGVSTGGSNQQQTSTLSLSAATLQFGSVSAGSSKTLSFTVSNSGPDSISVSSVSFSSKYFSLVSPNVPMTLAANQSTTVSINFSPNAAGSFTATASIASNASDASTSVSLSGTGTGTSVAGQLSVSPATLALGSVVVGNSGSGEGSLSATGADVTVSSASTNNAAFSFSSPTLPVTIPAGQSVPFTVTFTPQATGSVSATLNFSSNAQTSPTAETLTGTGTASTGTTYDVALSWNASTSSNISGYNIYRAVYSNSACGSFSKINPSLNGSTLYTDNLVSDGTSYCYATTAVNSSNEESGYSNIVSNVQIP